jgi:hypothetical protein
MRDFEISLPKKPKKPKPYLGCLGKNHKFAQISSPPCKGGGFGQNDLGYILGNLNKSPKRPLYGQKPHFLA